MKRSAFVLLVLGSIVINGFCTSGQASPRPFVIVGEAMAPFEYSDDEGNPAGINVELIDRIFTEFGIPYEIRFYPWARAWLMVENGAADGVLSVSYHPKREAFLHFTDEQKAFFKTGQVPPDFLWLTEYVFFTSKRLAPSVKFDSYEQIKRDALRVAVSDQYSYHDAFMESGVSRVVRSTPGEAMGTLLKGEADLYPMDRVAGWALLKQKGWQELVTWLPKPLFMKPYLLGFSRVSDYPGSEALMRRFYDRLRELRTEGTVERITARELDPIRPVRSARPLVFVCEDWPPFEYMKDGRMQGIDVDLVDRIMNSLRIPYEIRSYPWPRAWKMAEQGQVEAVLSVSYHPDREKVLYYTDGQRAAAEDGGLPVDYLWVTRYKFFVKSRNGSNGEFDSYDRIIESNLRVGLNKGYSYFPDFPADRFNSRYYFDTESGFMGLIQDEIDLYPMDMTVGRYTLEAMGLEKSVTALPKVLFSKAYLCPFVKKSDYSDLESIMYEFNYQVRQLRASGMLPY